MAELTRITESELSSGKMWDIGAVFELERTRIRAYLIEQAHEWRTRVSLASAKAQAPGVEAHIRETFGRPGSVDIELLRHVQRGDVKREYPGSVAMGFAWLAFVLAATVEMGVFGIQVYMGAHWAVLVPAVFLLLGGLLFGWGLKEGDKSSFRAVRLAVGALLIVGVSLFRSLDDEGFLLGMFLMLVIAGLAVGVFEAYVFTLLEKRRRLRDDMFSAQVWWATDGHARLCEKHEYQDEYCRALNHLEEVGFRDIGAEPDSEEPRVAAQGA